MRLSSLQIAIFLTSTLSYGMSFNTLCDYAYKASGEIIQTNGRLLANTHEKASALSYEPILFEGTTSAIQGKSGSNSGVLYGGMFNFQLKKPALQKATADLYDQNTKIIDQEIQLQQQLIQVDLKRDWLIAMLEQERLEVLHEKENSAKKAYSLGEKKLLAGRMSQMELMRLQSEVRTVNQELSLGEMEFEHTQHNLQETTMLHETIVIDDLPFSFIADDNRIEERIKNAAILKILNAQTMVLDTQIKNAHYAGNESISMGAGASNDPNQNSVNFTITIPLVFSEKNDKKIAALMAQKSALLHRRDITHQKLQMNIHTLLEHLETREKRFKEAIVFEKEQKMLMEMAKKGYEGGIIGQFEYLSTRNSYYNTRLQAIELKRDYIKEMSAMEEKLGRIWE